MTLQQIAACQNEIEARKLAITYADANQFNVADKKNEVHAAWMSLMCQIKSEGKEEAYHEAILLSIVDETLSIWA